MYTSNVRRIFSGLVDLLVILVLTIGIAFFMSSSMSEGTFQVLPFLLIQSIFFPFQALFSLIGELQAFLSSGSFVSSGNVSVFIMAIAVEAIYYFVMESLLHGSLGRQLLKNKVTDEHEEKMSLVQSFFRAIFKTISRYFFYLPMLWIFFSPKKQSLYDMLIKTVVVDK